MVLNTSLPSRKVQRTRKSIRRRIRNLKKRKSFPPLSLLLHRLNLLLPRLNLPLLQSLEKLPLLTLQVSPAALPRPLLVLRASLHLPLPQRRINLSLN